MRLACLFVIVMNSVKSFCQRFTEIIVLKSTVESVQL